jgi:hypothetical protein
VSFNLDWQVLAAQAELAEMAVKAVQVEKVVRYFQHVILARAVAEVEAEMAEMAVKAVKVQMEYLNNCISIRMDKIWCFRTFMDSRNHLLTLNLVDAQMRPSPFLRMQREHFNGFSVLDLRLHQHMAKQQWPVSLLRASKRSRLWSMELHSPIPIS